MMKHHKGSKRHAHYKSMHEWEERFGELQISMKPNERSELKFKLKTMYASFVKDGVMTLFGREESSGEVAFVKSTIPTVIPDDKSPLWWTRRLHVQLRPPTDPLPSLYDNPYIRFVQRTDGTRRKHTLRAGIGLGGMRTSNDPVEGTEYTMSTYPRRLAPLGAVNDG